MAVFEFTPRIIQDNNNSRKNYPFNKDIKQQLKQKYEELFFDKVKSTKENSKIYIYSKIKTEYNETHLQPLLNHKIYIFYFLF
jgi:hypothetical protein